MDPSRSRSRSVPDWVGQQYYRIGLMSASHPRPVLCVAVIGVIWSCWPLLSIPIYIGRPASHVELVDSELKLVPTGNSSVRPPWMMSGPPVAFVQQIIIKAMVHPYRKDELIKTDAFRGPLASAFKLHLEDVSLFRDPETGLDMDHVCLRTDGVADKYRSWAVTTNILPDYGCLILSPANLWQRDPRTFQMDPNVISTVFNFQKHQREGHSSLADLMFGLRQRDTGITKYPVRNRQRVVTYAVTIAFSNYNPTFVSALKKQLLRLYPLVDEISRNAQNVTSDEVVHLNFTSSKQPHVEWVPFVVTILMLFLYVYFSCKRIEFVKSKLGIAVSAIVTVICTTCMSLGLSGISLNMNSKISLVPYLVAFISLENILVVTQSVISTPAHLDVKIRIAQGLSKEGWNITKNLFAEITILTFIFLLGTIDASVQEFCHLAIMGLFADFFMQITFFITILSLDISQMELSDSIRKPSRNVKMFQKPFHGPGLIKKTLNDQTSVVAPNCNAIPQVPAKRVRLINFFAKNRIIQRMFLLCMVGWISIFIYQSKLLDNLIKTQHELFLPDNHSHDSQTIKDTIRDEGPMMAALSDNFNHLSDFVKPSEEAINNVDELKVKLNSLRKLLPIQRPNQEVWSRLPLTHWPMLFSLYNISLQGQYITLLPPIHLSMIIGTESAKMLRHPKEAAEKAASASEMAGDDSEVAGDQESYDEEAAGPELSPFVPTSPSELFLAFVLCFPSFLFILYLVVILYRCVCSRNYAEWRSSWNGPEHKCFSDFYTQIIQEAVPIELDGHEHEVECLACDGNIVISLCLGGTISTWDSYTGDVISQMNRSRYFSPSGDELAENVARKENASYSKAINSNFTSLSQIETSHEPYNFTKFSALTPKKALDDTVPISTSVWCMECEDGLVILGCASGRLEIWDAISGQLKGLHDDGNGIGVTHIKVSGLKLIVARLSGHIEFFEVKSSPANQFQRANSTPLTSMPTRRYHVRTGSNVSISENEALPSLLKFSPDDDIRLEKLFSARAHPQPLTCLDCQGGRILTGSHDHTLRVFRLDDYLAVYTLHGHCGPVTSAFIDKEDSSSACSGSQDGIMCTWDLLTGACVYSIQAHDGALLNLAYSSNYIISMGSDERLCVWERLQGHLINSIYLSGGPYCSDLVMLTHNLLITGRENSLVVWDVRLPDPVKIVKIGHPDSSQVVKIMNHLDDAIVCSYGSKLRLVRFPHFSGKSD